MTTGMVAGINMLSSGMSAVPFRRSPISLRCPRLLLLVRAV